MATTVPLSLGISDSKKIILFWVILFAVSAVSIAYTHEFLLSPIWVVNPLAGYFLTRLRKPLHHPLLMFLFAFSPLFLAAYFVDPSKQIGMKMTLSLISTIQILSFVYFYYYCGVRLKHYYKYKHVSLITLPILLSSLLGSLIFMVAVNAGENYFEFIDYFLEQFVTGIAVICILFGWRQWNLVPIQDYLLLAAMSVTQYLVSLDKIFYACLVLPLLISYYALRRNFLQFCWLMGLLVLFCCIYMTLPLAGEFWSKNDIYILSKISSYRLSLGIYLTVFLFVCEIYINNRRLYKALERLTFNDELTSLRTRRYVKKLINNNKLQEGSAILLDIDNFKQVNDQYGHAVGDQVLRHMAQLLRQAAPATAVVSRWGGEEFLVLLPKHD